MGQHKHVRITLNSFPVRSVGGAKTYKKINALMDTVVQQLREDDTLATNDVKDLFALIPYDEYMNKIADNDDQGDIAFIFIRRHKRREMRTVERMVHLKVSGVSTIVCADILPDQEDMTIDKSDSLYIMINDPTTWS